MQNFQIVWNFYFLNTFEVDNNVNVPPTNYLAKLNLFYTKNLDRNIRY